MRRHITQWAVLEVALAVIVSACAGSSPTPSPAVDSLDGPELTAALDSIHGSQIKQHMSVLADDALEGRGLGTPGYDGALSYVETTLKSYGLAARRRRRRLPAAGAAPKQRRRRGHELDEGDARGAGRRRSPTARTTCSARITCASR